MSAGKGLNDLDLRDEPLPAQALDDLPEFGSFGPLPQPGPYRFRLPPLDHVWEPFDVVIDGKPAQRVRALLEQESSLLIVGSPGGKANGDLFRTRLSNAERNRGGGQKLSDFDYLLSAFGVKHRPSGNRAFMEKVIEYSGREFGADITYNYSCNDQRNIRVYNEARELVEVEGQRGCGWRYYSGTGKTNAEKKIGYIGKHEGTYPTEIQCSCGAIVRAFANLENIRS